MQQLTDISSHYTNVSGDYNRAFFYAESTHYQDWVLQRILHHLRLQPSDRVVDIGCGTGSLTTLLYQQAGLRKSIIGIDLSPEMLIYANSRVGVEVLCTDAVSFSQLPDYQYDKALMTEAIHHIDLTDVPRFFASIRQQICDSGTFLIVTRPSVVDYPFFQAASDIWSYFQPDYKVYIQILEESGFSVDCELYKYPIEIDKKEWFAMIRDRFWSTFSFFSDDELISGLLELEEKYAQAKMLRFYDTLVFIEATVVC